MTKEKSLQLERCAAHASRLVCSAMLAAVCFSADVPSATAEKRIAMVIGIDRYDNLGPDKQLRNAVNDARAIAVALQKLGFDVQKAENAGRLELNQLWASFLNRVAAGDIVALYFSGHGVELGASNYLIPRDVPKVGANDEELLKSESISLARILEDLRIRRPGVSLLILDACRNNPFSDSRGRSIGSTRGLARVEPPRGTFVMYSAGVGQVALDRTSDADANPNSIYTRTLVPLLTQPGNSLSQIAREVRSRVRDLSIDTRHEQTPAYYDELIGDFYPAGQGTAASRPGVPIQPPVPAVQPSPNQAAAEAWRAVHETKSCAVLGTFLQQFPTGLYANFARARERELDCGETVAVPPASPPAPASVARELARFESDDLRGVVRQATKTRERINIVVEITNKGPKSLGLGVEEYPGGLAGSLLGDDGTSCSGLAVQGLVRFWVYSNYSLGVEASQQTIVGSNRSVTAVFSFPAVGCKGPKRLTSGLLTVPLVVISDGAIKKRSSLVVPSIPLAEP